MNTSETVNGIQRTPSGAGIKLRAVNKSFGERAVLQDLHLDLTPGEFVAVVGRSGCGKSTLLRVIAGLDAPDSGRVQFPETRHGTRPALRVMFQDARLLPWKSVIDNVALGLSGHVEKARAVLQGVGLLDRAQDWPAILSGGQRQRVALARALVHEPAVLLLDEPLGALDALTRIDMQQLIEQVWKERAFTAMLVTHDVQEAIALADRIVLIEDGKIALDEPVPLPRPRHRGTPEFARLEQKILERVLAVRPETGGMESPLIGIGE